MNHFQYKGNELYAEDVAIKEIVAKAGSPGSYIFTCHFGSTFQSL